MLRLRILSIALAPLTYGFHLWLLWLNVLVSLPLWGVYAVVRVACIALRLYEALRGSSVACPTIETGTAGALTTCWRDNDLYHVSPRHKTPRNASRGGCRASRGGAAPGSGGEPPQQPDQLRLGLVLPHASKLTPMQALKALLSSLQTLLDGEPEAASQPQQQQQYSITYRSSHARQNPQHAPSPQPAGLPVAVRRRLQAIATGVRNVPDRNLTNSDLVAGRSSAIAATGARVAVSFSNCTAGGGSGGSVTCFGASAARVVRSSTPSLRSRGMNLAEVGFESDESERGADGEGGSSTATSAERSSAGAFESASAKPALTASGSSSFASLQLGGTKSGGRGRGVEVQRLSSSDSLPAASAGPATEMGSERTALASSISGAVMDLVVDAIPAPYLGACESPRIPFAACLAARPQPVLPVDDKGRDQSGDITPCSGTPKRQRHSTDSAFDAGEPTVAKSRHQQQEDQQHPAEAASSPQSPQTHAANVANTFTPPRYCVAAMAASQLPIGTESPMGQHSSIASSSHPAASLVSQASTGAGSPNLPMPGASMLTSGTTARRRLSNLMPTASTSAASPPATVRPRRIVQEAPAAPSSAACAATAITTNAAVMASISCNKSLLAATAADALTSDGGSVSGSVGIIGGGGGSMVSAAKPVFAARRAAAAAVACASSPTSACGSPRAAGGASRLLQRPGAYVRAQLEGGSGSSSAAGVSNLGSGSMPRFLQPTASFRAKQVMK